MKSIFRLLFIINLSLVLQNLNAQSDVILQGFYWNSNPGDTNSVNGVWWDTLRLHASEFAECGFETIWTPPASKGFAGIFDMGYGVYDYLDFGSFDQKGTIRTRHGNQTQLEAMIAALHGEGLKVMADVVLNHRAGAEDQELEDCNDGDGLQLRFTNFQPASNRFRMDSSNFHPTDIHCDLFTPFHDRIFFEDICYFEGINTILDSGEPNDGWYFGPHNLGNAADSLILYGRYLLDQMGFDELRLDAVRHIEPGFLAPFLVEMRAGNQPFAVGEFFDGNSTLVGSYQKDVERFVGDFGIGAKNANMAIFDFPLRYALRDFCNDLAGNYDMWNLNSQGLLLSENLNGEDIVTFVENHDVDRIGWVVTSCIDMDASLQIGSTCLKLSTDSGHDPVFFDKHMAYAYIMAAEGRPSVFWKDFYWYGLDAEIKWLMALRATFAEGTTTTVQGMNPFFLGGDGGDLFALSRAGNGGGLPGNMLILNDDPNDSYSFFLDSPPSWMNCELKDYSDGLMFKTSQVFADGRAFYESPPRNYTWYAPTGFYPRPPGATESVFNLGNHVGAKLHFIALKAADAANFLINGEPIEAGDQIAITPVGDPTAVGLGRIGQSFTWDGESDMIIEVLGGPDENIAKGGLLDGEAYSLVVYDASRDERAVAVNFELAATGTTFSFIPNRPNSKGGAAPFSVMTTQENKTFITGGISQIISFEVCINEDWYADADGDGFGDPSMVVSDCVQPDGFVANNLDDCPDVFGLMGDSCDDGSPNTLDDFLDENCKCIGARNIPSLSTWGIIILLLLLWLAGILILKKEQQLSTQYKCF